MAEIVELRKTINKLIDLKYDLDQKIDSKLDAVDGDESKLGTHKASVTRWRNKMDQIQTEIDEFKAEVKKLHDLKAEHDVLQAPAQSGGGKSPLMKELKTLQHDFSNHPRFTSKLDVAVFSRHMQVLYDTHVSNCKGLEEDFVKLVECHLDTIYRVQLQRHVELDGRFTSWAEMKTYLVETHRSCSTLFQEMAKFTNIPMRSNESVREYCQRVKTAGEEAETIIRSKLKEELKAEPTARDIFELMQMDAVVRQMQAHPKYRDDYNLIVNQIDSCTTIDMLSQKASKIADRKVQIDELYEPRTYLNSKSQSPGSTSRTTDSIDKAVEKAMSKHLNAFMAQGHTQPPKTQPPKESSNREKTFKKQKDQKSKYNPFDDPEWRKKKANETCNKFAANNSCTRTNCPFLPCNKKSSEYTFYSKDF